MHGWQPLLSKFVLWRNIMARFGGNIVARPFRRLTSIIIMLEKCKYAPVTDHWPEIL